MRGAIVMFLLSSHNEYNKCCIDHSDKRAERHWRGIFEKDLEVKTYLLRNNENVNQIM